MLTRNLFTVSLRSILRDKGYTAINLVGLTAGITCSLYLLLFIFDELSYDRYHKSAENIYRVVTHVKEAEDEYIRPMVQIPLAPELAQHSVVKNSVRFFTAGRELFRAGDKLFYEERFYFADSTVFRMFGYEFIHGDATTALREPYSIVITRSMALKYFDTPDAVGKALTFVDRKEEYKVTGVIGDVPHSSHFHFDALMNVSALPMFRQPTNWGRLLVSAYVELAPGYDPALFQPMLDTVVAKHVNPVFGKRGIEASYLLQRITDIHLYSRIQDEEESGGDINFLYALGAVAAFLITIASINYMNLATARSARRAREVGIRKVMGSLRRQLIAQFTIEAFLFTAAALLMSFVLIVLLLPAFNQLTAKELSTGDLFDQRVIMAALGMLVTVGCAGGLYPALYLSSVKPAVVLKGNAGGHDRNTFLRKILVIAQFSISIFMLIATIVVYDQLRFMQQKDLGFNKHNVIRMAVDDAAMRRSLSVFKEKVMMSPSVTGFGTSSTTPGENVRKAVVFVEDNEGKMAERGVDFFVADYDFCTTMNMKIAEGRDFSRDVLADTANAVLVNEVMVRKMNWDAAIGKQFQPEGQPVRRVVGVIRDFHQNSLYNTIEPLVVLLKKDNYYTHIRIDGRNNAASLEEIERAWKQVYPGKPFEYVFMEDAFNAQYDVDQRRTRLLTLASALTIGIACLGLLGLTAFVTQQRAREISIRKVIGSSVAGIVFLISKDFITLVIVAALIAIPAGYFFMDSWLDNFAYRLSISGEAPAFVFASVAALLIAMSTVVWHCMKAAFANPVGALKSE